MRHRFILLLLFTLVIGSVTLRADERPRISVVWFVDGTRLEVRDYEVRGKVVVLTTLDGGLRSVPLDFVDLEATERWSPDRSTLDPVVESPARSSRPRLGENGGDAGSPYSIGDGSTVLLDGPPAPVAPEVVTRDGRGRATLRAVPIDAPLQLDGNLEEPVYRMLPGAEGFLQSEPDEGAPATERTEVWVLYDRDDVYISARCWDSDPERMVANEMRRDNIGLFLNENFAVVLDTFYDRRNAFFFYTNPLGGLFDGLVTDERDVNRDWNTVWDVKTGRFENGWTVEMVIPFKSLRYRSAGPQVWGINFRRIARWKNEFSYFTQIPASYGRSGFTKISSAGTLVGLETPPSSKNLEVKPYVTAGSRTDREAEPAVENDLDADLGLDVKYGVTRSLVFDFTYNTDFAQVEIDETQINLTRFNLFLPEKRDFFLEGRGIFQFGGTGQVRPLEEAPPSDTPVVFYTRRVGLEEDTVVPIIAGGRLTGRAGPYSIGVLALGTEEYPAAGIAETMFSVLRIKRDVLRRSAIGFVATHRSPALDGNGNNTVFGVDANLAFFENVRINTYVAGSDTPGYDRGDTSYLAQLDYQPDLFGLKLERLVAEPDFNPEIGFLRREDFQRNFAEVRVSRRPASIEAFRKVSVTGSFEYTTDNEGTLETRQANLGLQIELESSDQFNFEYSKVHEFLPEEFEINDEVTLPSRGYDFQNVRLGYELGPQRAISGRLGFQTGGFYSGNRSEVSYRLGKVAVSPRFNIEPRFAFNWVDVEEGEFTTNLVGARVNFTFSPRTALSALLQYSTGDDSFQSNVRFRWEYQPGSDLFVVYSDLRNTNGSGLSGLETQSLVVKFTRLFRF